MRYNNALSFMLSTGLICGPYHIQYPDALDYEYNSVESLGLEALGLDKTIKQLAQPIRDLNPVLGNTNMAATAVKFIRDMNSMFGTKYTVNDAIYQAAIVLQKNGMQVDKKKLAYMQKLLNDAQSTLGIGSGKKAYGDIDQMCAEEVKGYICLLCGSLLCIIPHPMAASIGASLIAYGIAEVAFNAGRKQSAAL